MKHLRKTGLNISYGLINLPASHFPFVSFSHFFSSILLFITSALLYLTMKSLAKLEYDISNLSRTYIHTYKRM